MVFLPNISKSIGTLFRKEKVDPYPAPVDYTLMKSTWESDYDSWYENSFYSSNPSTNPSTDTLFSRYEDKIGYPSKKSFTIFPLLTEGRNIKLKPTKAKKFKGVFKCLSCKSSTAMDNPTPCSNITPTSYNSSHESWIQAAPLPTIPPCWRWADKPESTRRVPRTPTRNRNRTVHRPTVTNPRSKKPPPYKAADKPHVRRQSPPRYQDTESDRAYFAALAASLSAAASY